MKTYVLNPCELRGCHHVFPFIARNELKDYGERKLNLTRAGTILWSPTNKGYGHRPNDTTSDYFTTGDIGTQPPSTWAYETLIYLHNTDNQHFCGYYESPGHNTHDRALSVDTGSLTIYIYDGLGKTAAWPGTLEVKKFYHILASTDGTNMHITVNGSSSSNTSVSNGGFSSYTSPEFIIGAGMYGSTTTMVGTDANILYVKVHDRHIPPELARSMTKDNFNLYKQPRPFRLFQEVAGAPAGLDFMWRRRWDQ